MMPAAGLCATPWTDGQLADEANKLGRFDAVIHNAAVYRAPGQLIFAVNTLAPYILTCMMHRPQRLIYMSSGLHMQGDADLARLDIDRVTYADSKLHNVILTMAVLDDIVPVRALGKDMKFCNLMRIRSSG